MTLYYSEGRMADWEENGWGNQTKGKVGEPRVIMSITELTELTKQMLNDRLDTFAEE